MLGLVFLVMLPFWAIVEYKSLPFLLCSMDDKMDALDSIMIWPLYGRGLPQLMYFSLGLCIVLFQVLGMKFTVLVLQASPRREFSLALVCIHLGIYSLGIF